MEQIYIGLGSNVGERFKTLLDCINTMQTFLKSFNYSSVWETEPMIVEDQPSFLNMVATGLYCGTPDDLIRQLWEMENKAGRNRVKERSKGPRPLDLDILLFGRRIIQTATLTIPHPGMTERAFVLVPLTEIDSSLTSPMDNLSYASFLNAIDDQGYICYKKRDEIANLLQQKR